MPASCPNHHLTAEQHCEEIERMLREVPGDQLEGDGDTPADAVRRLRLALEASREVFAEEQQHAQEGWAHAREMAAEVVRLRKVLREVTTRRPCFDTDCAHCLWAAEVVEATLSESVDKEPK